VPSKKTPEKFGVALDLSRIQAKYVPKQEVPGSVFSHRLRLEEKLCGRHSVEVCTIEL